MSAAIVKGVEVAIPQSLFIPPDALRVFLEKFEGPLDLLLYLIKKHQIDILDIPMQELTSQYMTYVERVVDMQLDLAAEYLAMSALLIEIKSRMMLPKPETKDEEDQEDPRAELVKRLLDYERIRRGSESLDSIPRCGRDFLTSTVHLPLTVYSKPVLQLEKFPMIFASVIRRRKIQRDYTFQADSFSVRDAISAIMDYLSMKAEFSFVKLFGGKDASALRIGVTFMATLELAKRKLLTIEQEEIDAPLLIRKVDL